MTTIRPIHEAEAEAIRGLWNEMVDNADAAVSGGWGRLSEESLDQIQDNLERTAAHPDAICLVADDRGALVGFVTASLTHHAVMPGSAGEIEELYVQERPDQRGVQTLLAQEAVEWLEGRGAGVIWSRGANDAPWAGAEAEFWTSLGFEDDQVLYSRY